MSRGEAADLSPEDIVAMFPLLRSRWRRLPAGPGLRRLRCNPTSGIGPFTVQSTRLRCPP
jgi:hypothetical protein